MNLCERYSGSKEFKRRLETLIRSKNIEETLVRGVTVISPPKKKIILVEIYKETEGFKE